MGAELGRISGPLLSANLLRHGSDLSFGNSLGLHENVLFLDVNSGRIGINTDTPGNDLTVNNTIATSNLIVDTQSAFANLTFVTYRIQSAPASGSIYIVPDQSIDPTIVANEIQTSKLKVSNNAVSTLFANDNIEITANGNGNIIFNTSKVNVNGDLHATGDITWDGTIIFGDSDADSVVFDAEIQSDLIPSANATDDLGTSLKEWNTLYSVNINANSIVAPNLTVNNINMLLTQGNTIYVSINGNDTNYGTHTNSTYRTIKKALSVAVAGDNIVVFPGTYLEDFPLILPQGVTITGAGLRSVTVSPTFTTNNKDAFLLNGECLISHLAVSGVSYDAVNNTGYAFRFAPNFKVTTKSPYVQNVTVINQSPNAGPGALVDGAVANPASVQASMLFHAVTFIVPGADGITATNGARVEWLNSFTYFANRGIYLTQGTLGFASLGVKYGAEMRSINSANVYGNYGAVADGANTLGYLVGHNFGYIGSGIDSNNDDQLTIQANEIVPINGGQLFYDSMDHKGDFRIGEIFYVNQQTGQVSFNAQSINFNATGSITIDGPTGQIIIDATKVQVSNIRIHDNNIDSLTGPVNFFAQSGTTTLNTNVFVTGFVHVSGNSVVSGNVYLGDTPYDLVTVFPNLTQNINPATTNTFTLGEKGLTPHIWNTAFLTGINVDGVTQITSNTISTLTSGTDLQLQAAGTGNIQVTSTDVQVDQSLTTGGILTVNGATNLQNTNIVGTTNVGTLLSPKNIGQTGNTYITGLFSNFNTQITGASSYFQVPDIKIQNNVISATATDSDLNFTGAGTAGVVFDSRLRITDNVITNVWASATTNIQKSIIFSPNGTGNLVLNSTTYLQVPYSNNTTKVLSAPGEIRQNSTIGAYEGYLNTGNESFVNVYSSDKKTYITPELTIGANDNTLRFVINNVQRATITSTTLTTPTLQVGNFSATGNTINNIVSGSDTVIEPTGTGSINTNNILFKDNNITNTTNSALTLSGTGTGYIKFDGTGAVVFPYGPSSDRRLTPELGEVRYNSTVNYMEVFDGTRWIPAVGTLGAAPLAEVLDIMDLWSLVLG